MARPLRRIGAAVLAGAFGWGVGEAEGVGEADGVDESDASIEFSGVAVGEMVGDGVGSIVGVATDGLADSADAGGEAGFRRRRLPIRRRRPR